jgi:hypothetical protein
VKIILMAFVAAGFIGSTTFALAETPVSPAEEEKIKAALEGFGCTGGKIEKEDYGYAGNPNHVVREDLLFRYNATFAHGAIAP